VEVWGKVKVVGSGDAGERVKGILWSEEWTTTHLDTLWEELL
jgi:hypothetical protein